jgi:hypothetical protein
MTVFTFPETEQPQTRPYTHGTQRELVGATLRATETPQRRGAQFMFTYFNAPEEFREFRRQFPNGFHSGMSSNDIDWLWQRGCELMDPESPVAEVAQAAMAIAEANINLWFSHRGRYGELNYRLSAVFALLSLKGITPWKKPESAAAKKA